ncbi:MULTISPECIES: AMP-dependent synthetase/ligase [unclassified Prosthecochloris]|uniref:AMP-dependent synthetase/ligase n=1 Tax=unclassified Prosthecochloris TaxID=2632826 RepID=UPI00223D75AF|nr:MULTISPECIES: long-chain fatty acid--CoA ligase [unclassified Prosthecochloris]UZJ38639.1 long-chain fatty acid--CoA ligase [Prosthecochloris sp. SCSIO W1103]
MGLIYPDFQTLPELFTQVFRHYKGQKKKFPIARKVNDTYEPISYDSFSEDVSALAAFLKHKGIEAKDRVAILSENRPGWYLADMAILGIGAADVPLYPSLPPNQIEYILKDSGSKAIIVSNMLQLGKVLSIWQNLPDLEFIIVMNRLDEKVDSVTELSEAKKTGHAILDSTPDYVSYTMLKPDDIATIIYTSGTTGLPKGVMLTHRNICENVKSCSSIIRLDESDRSLSFLPLSHSYERTGGYYLLFACGAQIYLAESIETVSLNIAEAKPTIIFTVPRLFDRIKANILKQIENQSPVKQKIFKWAFDTGITYHKQDRTSKPGTLLSVQHSLANKLVYTKIKEKFGGHLRYFVSGGAALPIKVGEFFQALGIVILEGYGLTETSPVTNVNRPEKVKFGTVGPAVDNVDIAIGTDGEILFKGPNIMKGYWNDEEATKEVIYDGWFHTGDIGELDEDGYLKITDRKKHIIVTSGGKNIAPLPIEQLIAENNYVDQVMVAGEKKPFLIALIVPNFSELESFAEERQLNWTTKNDLVELKQVRQIYESLLRNISRQLAAHEKVRKFLLMQDPFTIENGYMTPTLKLKRKSINKTFQKEIDSLYSTMNTLYNSD